MDNLIGELSNASIWHNIQGILATYGLKILGSIGIFIVAIIVAAVGINMLRSALNRFKVEITLTNFICRLGKVIVLGVGLLAALENLGVDTTSFVALFTACSFAIGFAFKETLSNIAAGVLVIIFRPFVLGDYVRLGAGEGRVKDISMFSVMLLTDDNTCLIVPNGKLVNEVIINYTREQKRLVCFERTIAADALISVKDAVTCALEKNEFKLADSSVNVVVSAINAADINIKISFWASSENYEEAIASANEALTKILL